MHRVRHVAAVILILLFILASGTGCSLLRRQDPAPGTDAEDEMDSFTASNLFTGETIHFPDDFPDQVVYLVFFADG